MKMEEIKVELISRETIKPSSPTPPHLLTHNLSFLDQIITTLYLPFFLFFSHNTTNSKSCDYGVDRCGWLKNSLSRILTHYYPFAGRLVGSNATTITCNDEGVDFYETQVKCTLSQVIDQRDSDSLNILFPKGFFWKKSLEGSLLGVQVNCFECGGMAVGFCICHRIADGCTISNFLRDWASMARQSDKLQVPPVFVEMPNGPFNVPNTEDGKDNYCVTKRFVFDASTIARLKASAVESGVVKHNPTRVLVTALLYKCVVAASSAKNDSFNKSIMIQLVNMRSRVDPSLPPKFVGNFTWYLTVLNVGKEVNMNEFVSQLREGVTELCDEEKKNLKMSEWLSAISVSMDEDIKKLMVDLDVIYKFSSHCNFPYYEVDFGLGKPVWVSMANGFARNSFVLMDTKDGDGIEATVSLEKGDMKIFECNEELLAFASLNLSA